MYDIIIIGGGPIGLACGIEAEKKNLKYLIVEKGCMVNSLFNYPKNMMFFSTSDKLEIGNVPFISHSPKPTRSEALEYYRRVSSYWKLNINLYENVLSTTNNTTFFEVKTNKNTYQSKNIIVATGFYDLPYLLNVEGEHLPKVRHYYDEAHPYFGMKIAIVGAANSAIDAALETYRKGAEEVTMVVREPEISKTVKYWVRPDVINRIKENEIKAFFNSQITKITTNHIEIKTQTETLTLENDFVLAMTGYQPNFKFLTDMGIKLGEDINKTPIYNTSTMETNIKGIFLAGVICGGLKTNKWFIENSRIHATTIINYIYSSIE